MFKGYKFSYRQCLVAQKRDNFPRIYQSFKRPWGDYEVKSSFRWWSVLQRFVGKIQKLLKSKSNVNATGYMKKVAANEAWNEQQRLCISGQTDQKVGFEVTDWTRVHAYNWQVKLGFFFWDWPYCWGNPANQLRLVVYPCLSPLFTKVLYIQPVENLLPFRWLPVDRSMATSTASSRKSKTHKVAFFFQYVETVYFVKRAGYL